MSVTTFSTPLNFPDTTLGLDYTAGDTTMTLALGQGAALAAELVAQGKPSISSSAPIRFMMIPAAAYNSQTGQISSTPASTIYTATGLSGDALSGLTAVEGTTDQDFFVGDVWSVRLTGGPPYAQNVAINNLEQTQVIVTGAPYITATPVASFPTSQALSALSTGIVKNTTTTGVLSIAPAGTDYVAPSGVSGGQTVDGGIAAGESLTLKGSAHASGGPLYLQTTGTIFDTSGFGLPRTYTFTFAGGVPATTGTNITNWSPTIEFNGKIVAAYINAQTGPTGQALIVDILLNGTSIWNSTPSNRLQIAAGQTSGSQTSFDTTSVTAGQVVTVNVVQVGSSIAGQYVTVQLVTLLRNT